jgi:regulator of protease activity HflC (stomatin/prohibitin superfamily)
MSTEKQAFIMGNLHVSDEDVTELLLSAKKKYKDESKKIFEKEKAFSASIEGVSKKGLEKFKFCMISNLHWVVLIAGIILCGQISYIIPFSNESTHVSQAIWHWLGGSVLFVTLYILFGLRVVCNTEELVISRLGYYLRTAEKGPRLLCFPGIIDTIEGVVDLEEITRQLYRDESGEVTSNHELDFGNDSAEVEIEAHMRITDSSRFAFTSENPFRQVENIIDSMLRPLIQSLGIDAAQVHKSKISAAVAEWIREDLEVYYGIYLIRILIVDIILSDETKIIRRRRLEAETDAQEEVARGASIGTAIRKLRQELSQDAGREISFDEAKTIYQQRLGLDTIEKTGANVTFVAPGVSGVLGTFDVSSTSKSAKE